MQQSNIDVQLKWAGNSSFDRSDVEPVQTILPSIPSNPTNMLASNTFLAKFSTLNTNVWAIEHLENYVQTIDFKQDGVFLAFYNTTEFQFYREAKRLGYVGNILLDVTSYDGTNPVETTRYKLNIETSPWRSTLSNDDTSVSVTYVKGKLLDYGEPSMIQLHSAFDGNEVPHGMRFERYDSPW